MANKYYYLSRPPSIGTQPPGFTGQETWCPKQHPPEFIRGAWGVATYPDQLPFQLVYKFDLFPVNRAEALCFQAWREKPGDPEGFLMKYLYRDPGELRMLADEDENFWACMILAYEIEPEQVESTFAKENESDE